MFAHAFMLNFEMARAVFQKLMTVMHKLCKMLSLCKVAPLWNNDQTDVGGPAETDRCVPACSALTEHLGSGCDSYHKGILWF